MKNRCFLRALKEGNTDSRPPIWLMRQAGRYMPEYRAIRQKYSFLEMVHTPEVAAEVTLLPIRLLDVDAAILFSDILVVAEAFGVGLKFVEGTGPVIERPVRSPEDVVKLPEPQAIPSAGDTIRILRKELEVPLIGFAGGPFTVASYMIEGGSSKDLKRTKQWMYADPASFHALLTKLADATADYLRTQVEAGAEALQIFDSWAHTLSHAAFLDVSLAYMKRIVDRLSDLEVPIILFCRGSSVFAEDLARVGTAGISLDWNARLSDVRQRVGPNVTLQGNLDPMLLYAPKDVIRRQTEQHVVSMAGDPRFIVNLGHGILPDMTVDAVRTLVDTVKQQHTTGVSS